MASFFVMAFILWAGSLLLPAGAFCRADGRAFRRISEKELCRECSIQASLFVRLGAQTLDFGVPGLKFSFQCGAFFSGRLYSLMNHFFTGLRPLTGNIRPEFAEATGWSS